MIIFKAKPAPVGKTCGRKGTVTHKIHHSIKDKWGNSHPAKDECYITVSASASSSCILTLDYLDKVYWPEVGAEDGELVDPLGGWSWTISVDTLTRLSRNTIQSINCSVGFSWMEVSPQRPNPLMCLSTIFSRDSFVISLRIGP